MGFKDKEKAREYIREYMRKRRRKAKQKKRGRRPKVQVQVQPEPIQSQPVLSQAEDSFIKGVTNLLGQDSEKIKEIEKAKAEGNLLKVVMLLREATKDDRVRKHLEIIQKETEEKEREGYELKEAVIPTRGRRAFSFAVFERKEEGGENGL